MTTITKTVHLPAARHVVWDHLTRADLLGKWFHPAEADLAVGRDFVLRSARDGDRMCWGRVVSADPVAHLRWTFTVGPLNGRMTRVDWHLAELPGGTRLTLEHSGLPDDADAFGLILALDKGWHGFVGDLQGIAMQDLPRPVAETT
ncbi:SRPBCC domain-containing protein [Thalassococcus sp. CAU 1522]|uniref:SRPBCC domain-containing protein n=1 Tax=Thalassococcus arenae TaxID=2851652 RepID=A0ABS6N8R5_9RHOB|nr:SRPBCC domain-containing protein [Thalassococcus arenae]MBV2360409.1 SRPBCC domain-containing protein [Thalassococcus arenae]